MMISLSWWISLTCVRLLRMPVFESATCGLRKLLISCLRLLLSGLNCFGFMLVFLLTEVFGMACKS